MAGEINLNAAQRPMVTQTASESLSKMGGGDSTKLKEVVGRAMEVLAGANLKVSRSDTAGADGAAEKKTSGATNVPALDNPGDPEQVEANLEKLIAFLQLDNQERQTKMAKDRIEGQKASLDVEHKGRMKEIDETIKKMQDAEKAAKANRVFGWLGAILSVVAAVVLTVVTGGLAAGFAIAGAAIAVTSLVMNETGAMNKLIEKLAEHFQEDGMSKNDAMLKASLIINLSIMAASLVCSVGGLAAGLASAASSAGEIAKTVQSIVTIANTGVSAGALATGGVSTYFSFRSQDAQADVTDLEKFIAMLQQRLDESNEELKLILQQIEAGLGKIVELLVSATDTSNEIAQNIGAMA